MYKRQIKYTINELAQHAKVSRRTVRYYIQRGLLNPPLGKGRGSHYTSTHLKQLLCIRDQQLNGVALEEINPNQDFDLSKSHFASTPSSTLIARDQARDTLTRNTQIRDTHPNQSHSLPHISQWTHIHLSPEIHLNVKMGHLNDHQVETLCQLIQNFIHTQSGENQ